MSSQQRILTALKEARQKLEAAEYDKKEPIAIVGMGCRFPGGADTPAGLWELLRDGVDAMIDVPADRWSIDEYYDPDPEASGKMYVRDGGFLSQIDQFDPEFFRISPREAASMDPQQRLMLEVVWEALENAGLAPSRLRGSRTGFFMGLSWHDYEREAYGLDPHRLDAYAGMGNTQSIAVGRLAYVLGVHGPTALVDTACSASLVAVHLACQSLRTRDADLVLAGGVNLMISPLSTIFCCKIRALSPTGRCHTFDAAADGYARGEGCGVVVLKRLRDAVADGDNILALIRGSAINHDGPSSGLTVPNRRAQQHVIEQALASGDVDPLDVSYVEAHGTGTSLGDPIEVGALGDALGRGRPEDDPLLVGSIKTNFGHLEAAAGVAGLMKVVLSLQHGKIPPHLQFSEPNPQIEWDAFPVEVATGLRPWPNGRRVAGVSSFGFSGTNAHVVLEAAPPSRPRESSVERSRHVLTLSAKSDTALTEVADRYVTHLASHPEVSVGDVCFTANTGRSHFAHRLAVVAESTHQLREQLAVVASGDLPRGASRGRVSSNKRPKIAFLFTGQGAQYVGMGRELYETQPTFRTALDECDRLLRPHLDRALLDVVYATTADGTLDTTAYTQPALFALEYALARLWQSWGVEPAAVIGHSVGEYVAACVAGAIRLDDGLRLIAERGRLMQELPRIGAMLAVFADEDRVAPAIAPYRGRVDIASVNGPATTVISGHDDSIQAVRAALEEDGVETRPLNVSHAFHSPLMEPMLPAFEQVLREVEFSTPRISLVSNVTGALATEELVTPAYWCRHVRQPVRFAAGMTALQEMGCDVFVEIGPHPVLVGMGRHCLPDAEVVWLASLRRNQSDWEPILGSVGALHVHGVRVDWAGVDRDFARRREQLPTYPFQRRRYWVEPASTAAPSAAGSAITSAGHDPRDELRHPLLGRRVHSAAFQKGQFQFERTIGRGSPPYLEDHRIFEMSIPPATMFVEMALAAAMTAFETTHVVLEDFVMQQALILPEESDTTLQCLLTPDGSESSSVKIHSFQRDRDGGDPQWVLHAVGRVSAHTRSMAGEPSALVALPGDGHKLDPADCYRRFRDQGIDLGPRFQAMKTLKALEGEVVGEVRLPDSLEPEAADYLLHPVLLDACGQAVACAFQAEADEEDTAAFLPIGLDRLTTYGRAGSHLWFDARIRSSGSSTSDLRVADLKLFDAAGTVVAEVEGATTRRSTREAIRRELGAQPRSDWLYEVAWRPAAPSSPAVQEAQDANSAWLIFADAGGLGRRLAQALEARGEQCVVVSTSPGSEGTDDAGHAVDPGAPEDFTRLLEEHAGQSAVAIRGIVYLWGLEPTAQSAPAAPHVEEQQASSVQGLLHLTQSLLQRGWTTYPRLWVVTRGTQPVGDAHPPVAFTHAPLWSFRRVLALEHPEVPSACVDLPPAEDEDDLGSLLSELSSAPDGESDVAYREGRRHVARLVRRTEGDTGVQGRNAPAIRSEGSYLVTGGLGALGLEVAEWLAAEGAGQVVLMGRRKPDGSALEAIRRMKDTGADVVVAQADVTRQDDVGRVIESITASGAPLKGIVHAAGVLQDGVLLQQSWERFRTTMAPKVTGTLHLHALTREMPLDFFVCFSSAASVLGSRGQGNYAAANAFLDSLAHHRRSRGLPGLSINWGPWAGAGMAADLDSRATRRMHEQGWTPIAPHEGIQTMAALASQDVVQAGVLPLTWSRFLTQFPSEGIPPYFAELTEAAASPEAEPAVGARRDFLNELQETPPGDRRELLATYLQDRVAATIGLASRKPPRDQSFGELGLDSLMHMELRNQITTDLSVTVPMAEFLSVENITALTDVLLRHVVLSGVAAAQDFAGDPDEDMEEITL